MQLVQIHTGIKEYKLILSEEEIEKILHHLKIDSTWMLT